jgi:hypothetical protein
MACEWVTVAKVTCRREHSRAGADVYVSGTYVVTFVHFSDIQRILATSLDHEKLLHTWTEYQRRFSSKIQEYSEILQLVKVAAEANGEDYLRYCTSVTSYLDKAFHYVQLSQVFHFDK